MTRSSPKSIFIWPSNTINTGKLVGRLCFQVWLKVSMADQVPVTSKGKCAWFISHISITHCPYPQISWKTFTPSINIHGHDRRVTRGHCPSDWKWRKQSEYPQHISTNYERMRFHQICYEFASFLSPLKELQLRQIIWLRQIAFEMGWIHVEFLRARVSPRPT